MRFLYFVIFSLLASASAEEPPKLEKLRSDSFEEREKAAEAIIDWVRADQSKDRAELLFQKYLMSKEPEEFHRLTKILLKVHFEHKKDIIPQQGSGFIGINMVQNGVPPNRGVRIRLVLPDTPAERAGLKPDDLILAIDEIGITGPDPTGRLQAIVSNQAPGSKILLSVEREEQIIEVPIVLMNHLAVEDKAGRVDLGAVERLLREDYLRWLRDQRLKHQRN